MYKLHNIEKGLVTLISKFYDIQVTDIYVEFTQVTFYSKL